MSFSKQSAFDRLSAAHCEGRLAHAYLFAGPPGSGKEWLARKLSELVLGTNEEGLDGHSDLHWVEPESKSRRITIDQIRVLDQSLQMKSLRGVGKAAVICEADRLQPQAANAFLKTLEEPPERSHIFLLTALKDAVLETIQSRCISVILSGEKKVAYGPDQSAVAALFKECLGTPGQPGLVEAFRLTRGFQQVLGSVRARIASEMDEELDRDTARYKQSTEGKWLEDREEQMKAMGEAAYIREREGLLQCLAETMAESLRSAYLPGQKSALSSSGGRESEQILLARLEALEKMRDRLARGVQEGLALETGFLELICLS